MSRLTYDAASYSHGVVTKVRTRERYYRSLVPGLVARPIATFDVGGACRKIGTQDPLQISHSSFAGTYVTTSLISPPGMFFSRGGGGGGRQFLSQLLINAYMCTCTAVCAGLNFRQRTRNQILETAVAVG